jgi:effector-binding domain-containing protein
MEHSVKLTSVSSAPLLVVRRRATLPELSKVVPEACGVVWTFIRRAQVASHGRNVAVYLNDKIDVIDMEVGVEVGADVGADRAGGEVTLSGTPAGTVATTTHVGPYTGLPGAHEAVRQWCKAGQHRLAGPNWEVYGHWSDDPAKLRTDVFYLLRADAMPPGSSTTTGRTRP